MHDTKLHRSSHKTVDIIEKVIFFSIVLFSFFLFCICVYNRTLLLSHFSVGFLQSFMIVACTTPFIIRLAKKYNVVDVPDERKHHICPTPLLGGVGIFISFTLGVLLNTSLGPEVTSIVVGGSIIFVLGVLDDIVGLSSTVRLIGQVAAALMVISSGLVVTFTPDTWWGNGLGIAVTIIWILGIVNTLNFADGVDGLATGIAVIAAIFFALISSSSGHYEVSLIAIMVIGAGVGFLFFNFKPAKIYLGDSGSTFLGFVLASVALFGQWSDKGPVIALGIPVLILGLLIFDMCYITVSRVISGRVTTVKEWLDYTGRDHFHHRLLDLGLSERQTVVFMYSTCFILGLSALVLESSANQFYIIALVLQATGMLLNVSVLMIVGRNLASSREMLSRELRTEKILIDVFNNNVAGENAFLVEDLSEHAHMNVAEEQKQVVTSVAGDVDNP
ncbi:MAG: undecaprenyl/decaprenyl-phosphate alpha-N-acetylglucosaminyl 1-phosphate transferase [Candidatus Omnitrophica bacterium]|nr:undecaprenyl/decaprenyl-phosphate alpha-N-acetylglucosaminyl 1-phosphate transferase [Candidatus Omnitrophota bacterium]